MWNFLFFICFLYFLENQIGLKTSIQNSVSFLFPTFFQQHNKGKKNSLELREVIIQSSVSHKKYYSFYQLNTKMKLQIRYTINPKLLASPNHHKFSSINSPNKDQHKHEHELQFEELQLQSTISLHWERERERESVCVSHPKPKRVQSMRNTTQRYL